ncbi:MAG: hypothetical protein ACI8P0_004484 [Planctomycetaceae bacterium]
MSRLMLSALLFVTSCVLGSVALAAPVTITVTIQSVDPEARTITVLHKDQERSFDLTRRTKVLVTNEPSDTMSLATGDTARLTYEDTIDVVLKIEADGEGTLQWRFFDVMNKGVTEDNAISITAAGTLVCRRDQPFFCLASSRQYSAMTLTLEFQSPPQIRGSAAVYLASSLPRPKEEGYKKQIPRGLQFKLGPGEAGDLILPAKEFKVDRPLGQLRDGRRVVAVRKPELKPTGWNTLEIVCDQHSNVTFKINDITINAVAKVEAVRGHILLGITGAELLVRNVVVRSGETETPLPFEMLRLN